MPFFAQNLLNYPKVQHSKECFTKLWIVICKSLSKYEIMPKITAHRKNAIFGPNVPHLPKISKQQTVLLNFGLSFAKAYQNIKLYKK